MRASKLSLSVEQVAVEGGEEQENSEQTDDTINYPLEMNEEWRSKFKHLFILSEAGKPIYSL